MRKITGILIILMMAIGLACMGAATEDALMTGGWQSVADYSVTEELRAIFNEGMDGLTGVRYVPVVYLGSQLAAGINHAFLCQAAPVVPDADPSWKIVYLYEDLNGNITVMNIADFDFGSFCTYGIGLEEEWEKESAGKGQYEEFITANGEAYGLFVITKMNYGEDHRVISVTGHFERVIQGEDHEVPEIASASEKTYELAADFYADMVDEMMNSEMAFTSVTDLYTWYIEAYLGKDFDGHELVFSCDLPEEEQLIGDSDFWFVTTRIMLNDRGEIQYMKYVYVPWA